MIVARTDMAYPDLWVAPGSKDTALGQHYGMQEDFVTGGHGLGMWQKARLLRICVCFWGTVVRPGFDAVYVGSLHVGWDIKACSSCELAALGVPPSRPLALLPNS